MDRDAVLEIMKQADPLFANLTTPLTVTAEVLQFTRVLNENSPIYLDCCPEPWSRQNCCEANVVRFIEAHGGKMLCGYRIWFNEPRYIEGERHAVWTDGKEVRDVSFVDTGEPRILFLPDQLAFEGAPKRVRFAFNDVDKKVLAQYEEIERILMPIQTMPAEQAWEVFPTYVQWQQGARVPNVIPALMEK
jgi:hypothetical protein